MRIKPLIEAAAFCILCTSAALSNTSVPPSTRLIDGPVIEEIRNWVLSPVVGLTLAERNQKHASLTQEEIDKLDEKWRSEREQADQPLITAVLSSPLSNYLTRIQANSLGLYSEIFVIDSKGLNAGQSAITSDYWQGDEAKWQKTFLAGPKAVFVDEPEFNEDTGTWRVQVNLSIEDGSGNAAGSVTVEINLTELERRHSRS